MMEESVIQDFWSQHPCGDHRLGSMAKYRGDCEAFFRDYDRFRYSNEPHILQCLDRIDFAGKHTLEIGLGQGADAEQIIRRGALWSGIDLTEESVERVRVRLGLRELRFNVLKQGSALSIPFEDNSFDIVFSHGVLHHVPNIDRAQREIFRVLRPDGVLIVMVYSKRSLNYWLSICLLRRLGLVLLYILNYSGRDICGQHLQNVRSLGLRRYLKMSNFIHRNTDGPLNPYSKVYDLRTVRSDFSLFRLVRTHRHLMHAPPLPAAWLPGERLLGWHLWVHMKPVKS